MESKLVFMKWLEQWVGRFATSCTCTSVVAIGLRLSVSETEYVPGVVISKPFLRISNEFRHHHCLVISFNSLVLTEMLLITIDAGSKTKKVFARSWFRSPLETRMPACTSGVHVYRCVWSWLVTGRSLAQAVLSALKGPQPQIIPE